MIGARPPNTTGYKTAGDWVVDCRMRERERESERRGGERRHKCASELALSLPSAFFDATSVNSYDDAIDQPHGEYVRLQTGKQDACRELSYHCAL